MIVKQKHNPKRVGALVAGDCFYYEGEYYLKTNLHEGELSVVVNIDTGMSRNLSIMQQVIKVNTEVTVTHEP